MTSMSEETPAQLSREDIYNAFLREAETATEQIVSVNEKLAQLHSCEAALRAAHAEYSDAHSAARTNPVASAKLDELRLPDPAALSVTVGGSRPSTGRKASRKSRPSSPKSSAPRTPPPASVSSGSESELQGVTGERVDGSV